MVVFLLCCQAGGYLKAVPGLWVYTAIGLGLAVYIRAAARATAGVAGDLVAECAESSRLGTQPFRNLRARVSGSSR
jgi:hypothetical protein